MIDIEVLVRENIRTLCPYSSARDESGAGSGIFLDANENPYGTHNRYPDPYQQELKAALSRLKSVPVNRIFIGNGSDEVIDLLYRIFCRPGIDKALTFTPTYGLYQVAADINDIELIRLPLQEDFQIDIDALSAVWDNDRIRLIFICSPNNPTGNYLEGIETILQHFRGIVVVDEAYIDFAAQKSLASLTEAYQNLVVIQTLSKAWGLAAARIGIAFSNPAIIQLFNKVKPPYNVSSLNQEAALHALADLETFENRKTILLQQRAWLEIKLQELPVVTTVYPSDANFLLVKMVDANLIYQLLVHQGIITRNRHQVVRNCIRISVGTPEENQTLIEALRKIKQ